MSSGISSAFYDLPFLVKCVILPLAFLVVCSVLRLIANRLPSQSPPVFEGIPFIGGVLKFVQVRDARQVRTARPLLTANSNNVAICTHDQSAHVLLLHQGPKQLLEQGYKKYGEVFTVPVLNKKITFLIGTDVTPFFFKATDEDMSQQEVCSTTKICDSTSIDQQNVQTSAGTAGVSIQCAHIWKGRCI